MTAAADRRSVVELQARYEFEPSLQDIYVEGPTDRALIDFALARIGKAHSIRAYEISDIDIPAALLEGRSLPIGNKSRVISLADELHKRCTRDLKASVVCLADLDLDTVLGRRLAHPLLVYTSGLSLDSVLVSENVIAKLLSVVLLAAQSPSGLFDQMLPILNERVLHRIACEELGIVPSPIELRRVCSYDGETLQCDFDSFVHRLLQSASAAQREGEFLAAMDGHRTAIEADPAYYVHADDFIDLLHFCSHRIRSRGVPDVARFRRFLFGFLDADSITTLPELREITSRFGIS